MIIPIRCVTCGKVLANKWTTYQKKLASKDKENESHETKPEFLEPRYQKDILREIGVERMCCVRHMLSHVDLIDRI